MKKIVLFLLVALFSINSYSQKSEGDTWREVAKYLYDEGFDRAELRTVSYTHLTLPTNREV